MDFIIRAKSTAERGIRPYPLPDLLRDNPLHLSTSLKAASSTLQSRGATIVRVDPPDKTEFSIPDPDLLLSSSPTDPIHQTCLNLTIQHALVKVYSERSPALPLVKAVLQKNPNDLARVSHLQQITVQGSDVRLAVDPSKPIKYVPMAFLTRHHPAMISKFQLGLYVKMCLGLDVQPQQAQVCPCGALLDANLGHTLGCRKWAGRSWHAAHDGVVTAVKELAQRAGLRASDSHSLLRRDYRHPNSGEMADVFIDGGGHLSVTDAAPQFGIQHPKFMADVTMHCPITTHGTWEGHLNADCTWSSPGLQNREAQKFQKHETAYAVQNLGFLALTVSTFGLLGPTFIRFLAQLATAKVASFVDYRSHQRLSALSTDQLFRLKAQYLAGMFARIGDATAKGTIMRFMGIAQPPLVPPPPRCSTGQQFLPVDYAGAIAGFLSSQPRRRRQD